MDLEKLKIANGLIKEIDSCKSIIETIKNPVISDGKYDFGIETLGYMKFYYGTQNRVFTELITDIELSKQVLEMTLTYTIKKLELLEKQLAEL